MLFQHLDVTIFALGSAGGFLHELEELAEIFPLSGRHATEANSNSSGRTAAGDDPVQRETFDPDLAIGKPQADFNLCPGSYSGRRFHQTASGASIGEISPDRRGGIIHSKLDGYKALDSWMAAPVAAPVGAKEVWFKGRCRRYGCWERLYFLLSGRLGRLRGLNLAHGRDEGFFALFNRSFAVRL